jgi:hypothetical protein
MIEEEHKLALWMASHRRGINPERIRVRLEGKEPSLVKN